MQKLKKWDPVMVTAGKFKWQISKISKHLWNSVVVEWVNVSKRARKWKWLVDITKPINVSNVAYYSEKNKWISRISFVVDWDKKQRKLVKFDQIID